MLTRGLRRIGSGLAFLGCAFTAAVPASEGNSLEFKNEVFWDRNDVWNITPAFLLKLGLSRFWSLSWEQEVDAVSGASRRIGADRVGPFGDRELDGISGASSIPGAVGVEIRHSENPTLTYAKEGFTASGSFYFSQEADYLSFSPSASLSQDFNERNTTVGASYAEFFDDFRPLGAFADEGGKKRIRSWGATLAQSLTPLTLVGMTVNGITSWGYLGHPYNPPADASGTLLTESLPYRKRAGALSGQIVQGFLFRDRLGSVNLDVRGYRDSWGLASTTADLKLSWYVTEETYVRLRGRYYTQSGADFAKDVYTGSEAYRTADIRFFPFSSYLAGFKISGPFPEAWEESALLPDRWDVKYDHLLRNTYGDLQPNHAGESRRTRYQLYGPDEQYLQGVFMFGLLFDL